MFDRLFEFLERFWDYLWPLVLVRSYERGVVLRKGVFHRELGPGFHLVWSLFNYEEYMSDTVISNSFHMKTQSLTTQDGKSVNISCVGVYAIKNIRKFLLEVEGRNAFLTDCIYASVSRHVMGNTLEYLCSEESHAKLFKDCRARAFRKGIELEDLAFADFSVGKGLRLWQTAE